MVQPTNTNGAVVELVTAKVAALKLGRMVAILVIANTVLLLVNVCLPALAKQAMEVAISEVAACSEYKNLPYKFTKIQLRVDHTDGDLYVTSDVRISLPIDDPTVLRLEFYKCVSKEVESCRLYKTIEQSTICDHIGKDEMVWTPILDSIKDFEKSCPVRPGVYKMADAPLTKAVRENVPLTKGHWRVKTTLLKEGKVVGCQKGYGEVKPKRRSKSKDDPKKEDVDDNDDGDGVDGVDGVDGDGDGGEKLKAL